MHWMTPLLWLLAICGASAAELTPSAEADAKFAKMEKSIVLYQDRYYTIEEALERNQVAGVSVVIIYDGKPAIHRWYGLEVKRKNKKTDAKTIYQCASTSKLISALGVVTAAGHHEVQLDEPVTAFNRSHRGSLLTEWVDKYFKGSTAAWADDITLRRLLSHSAGLDVHGIGAAPWLPSNEPLESIIFGKSIFKDAAKPIHEPGTRYEYSGGGFTVAEAWLEIATGYKFKDYLKANVLDPLGMSQSTYETGTEDTPHLAWGCSRGVCLYNVRTLDVKAAGGLLCHPVDYARAVALLMNGGQEYLASGNGRQVIPPGNVVEILSPSKHKDTGEALVSGGGRYGLGTALSKSVSADGLPTTFSHSGAQQGFSSEFFADRNRKVGVVVVVNGDRDWSWQREQYGGATLSVAILKAFKVAFVGATEADPLKPRCIEEVDCPWGTYCNAGVDIYKNSCEPKKPNEAACDLVNGAMQCQSGHCNFGRCYEPNSVAMGGTCYVDAACSAGKCSAVDGTRGTCVCHYDADCSQGGVAKWCDAGLDTKINACRAKLAKGASCGKAGSFGNDHKCKSGKCSGFPKYECK